MSGVGEFSTFWESVRHLSGWGWALAELERNPALLDAVGPRWRESPLHWAMLGHLEASSILCLRRPGLLFSLDDQGRAPLDWAVEKVFFLRKQQESELPSERAKTARMIDQARTCAMFALQWIVAQQLDGAWSGSQTRFQQLALSAGELAMAEQAELALAAPTEAAVWLCGLAGAWETRADVAAYLESLRRRHGIGPEDVAHGKPLGLHVAKLWADGAQNAQRATWFHECGARLDQETAEESVEVYCAAQGEAGAARWEKMSRQLGL